MFDSEKNEKGHWEKRRKMSSCSGLELERELKEAGIKLLGLVTLDITPVEDLLNSLDVNQFALFHTHTHQNLMGTHSIHFIWSYICIWLYKCCIFMGFWYFYRCWIVISWLGLLFVDKELRCLFICAMYIIL